MAKMVFIYTSLIICDVEDKSAQVFSVLFQKYTNRTDVVR